MNEAFITRKMRRDELDVLVDWAALEGWNPGLHDADIFWRTDPDAYIAADLRERLIGGGAITAYGNYFGFMGFFIVKPEFRGRGFGNRLWHLRRERLKARLKPGAIIGMEGVFAMRAYYARGGFIFSHRNLRYRTDLAALDGAGGVNSNNVIPLSQVPFDQLMTYDRLCFPADRETFLKAWILQPEALSLGYVESGILHGFGVIRRCRDGCKVGPLFANNDRIAGALLGRLALFSDGGPIFLDVPENNTAAISLAKRYSMEEIFGCARMYLGSMPDIAQDKIFAVTTFELG
ncbi:GNAT family N-acetyltransferase [Microbulbifer sp. OS29]|uniref:GNAT family N-acetyltransferase n=1 Tax=Microbulbifer okhotskensis TaxID=2926617 RepID=A0A9X2ENY2_9GAMM|nr:GNAT family N-acetyltransferase [Microbulbifer okhotskensis]MCO1335139.1 GNAT family N-acetyltransferase [Microbulbifer okhotskensis]